MEIRGRSFLVTGGASLIGSHLVDGLLAEGAARVVVFDNFLFGGASAPIEHERVELVRGDVLRLPQLLDAADGVNGVFAMAALLTLPMSHDPSMGIQVNVQGLLNTLEACRVKGVAKVVLASSIAVYGDNIDSEVVESTPFRSASLSPPFALYALTKLTGEQLGRLYAEKHGVAFSAVRFSTVYGERQHSRGVNALHILESHSRIRAGERPLIVGDGSEAHDYLYVTDAANAAIRAMSAGLSGEAYTIATGVSTSVNRVVELVLAVCGSELEPEFVPDTRAHRATTHSRLALNIGKAREQLSWVPQITLEQGIRRLVAWAEERTEAEVPPR